MDNLTLGEVLKLLLWLVTAPLWFPVVWIGRKLRGKPKRLLLPLCLCALVVNLAGCSDSHEARVERTEAEITRALSNAKKVAVELAKAEKTIADEKAKLAELIGKLNGLIAPKPNPAPSPVPPGPTPGPLPPVPSPLPSPSEPVDGRFAICARIYRMALAVKTDDLKSEAAQFAANFRAVAKLVKDGKTDSLLADKHAYNISVELTKLNKPLTKSHPAWLPPAEQLGTTIADLYNDGKINNNVDWCDVLLEVADALDAVSKAVK